MIISIIDKSAGFFSQLFFSLNHYIYSRKHNEIFILDSSEWMFKYKIGWEDYFETPIMKEEENINPTQNQMPNIKIGSFLKILDEYPISEYKNYLKDYYVYNRQTREQIKRKKEELNLLSQIEYGSIFIRRGDRLFSESKLIAGELYIKMLLEKYPTVKIVFLQTEDYTCYEEIQQYINENKLNIQIKTLCKPHQRGSLISRLPNYIHTNIENNKNYINNIREQLHNTIEVINMTPEQKYIHTMDMIIGLDIVLNSKICICDYQSNVSRFIKLAHKNENNVYDVLNTPFDYTKKICPSYPTSIYDDPDKFINT